MSRTELMRSLDFTRGSARQTLGRYNCYGLSRATRDTRHPIVDKALVSPTTGQHSYQGSGKYGMKEWE